MPISAPAPAPAPDCNSGNTERVHRASLSTRTRARAAMLQRVSGVAGVSSNGTRNNNSSNAVTVASDMNIAPHQND